MNPNFEPFWYFILRWFLFHFSCFTFFFKIRYIDFIGVSLYIVFLRFLIFPSSPLNARELILPSECSRAHAQPTHWSLDMVHRKRMRQWFLVGSIAHFRTQGRGPNLKNKKNQKNQYFRNPGPRASEPRVPEILVLLFFCFFRFGLHPCIGTCAMLPKTDMHNIVWLCNQMLAHVQNRPCRQWPQCKEVLYEKWVFRWGEMLHFIKHAVSPRRERIFWWYVSKQVDPHSPPFCIYIYILS